MSFRGLKWILFAVFVYFAYSGYKTLASREEAERRAIHDRDQKIARLEKEESQLKSKLGSLLSDKQSQLEQSKNELAQARDQLELIRTRLQRESNGGVGGQDIPLLQEKVAQQKEIVANLQAELDQLKSQKRDLKSQAKTGLDYNHASYLQGSQYLEVRIARAEQELADAQAQASPAKANRVKEIRSNLQRLREEKKTFSSQSFSDRRGVSSELQTQTRNLDQYEADLKQQLQSERNRLAHLKQDLDTATRARQSMSQEMKQTEADLQVQKNKVDTLTRSVGDQERALGGQ